MAYNNPQLIKMLAVIVKRPGNNVCADCNMPNPTWASFNLGLFICMNCSGVHRMLGTHITRIRSITLDHWDEAGVSTMTRIGNKVANSYWEARLPPSLKINANTDERSRTTFIRNKYENRLWYGQPTAAPGAGAAEEEDAAAQSSHPGEEGMTREQKRALRMQQRGLQSGGGSLSPSAAVSRPASVAGVGAGGTNGYGVTSPPPPQAHLHTPALRHAISSPQIATHSSSTDLFSGAVIRQPQPAAAADPYQSSPQSQQAARPKRITGASPWVQRPAGSEPPAASFSSLSLSGDGGSSAANAYAAMAVGGAGGPPPGGIDLLNTNAAVHTAPSTAPATHSASFDFLNDSPATAEPAASSSAFDFLAAAEEAPAVSSGFDFVNDSGSGSALSAAPSDGGPKKSRITDDMFSGLVDLEPDAPPVSLEPEEFLTTRTAALGKETGGGLLPHLGGPSAPAAPLPPLPGGPTSAPAGGPPGVVPGAPPGGYYPYPYPPPPPGAYPYPYPPPGAAAPNGAVPPHPHYPPPGGYPAYPYPPPGSAGAAPGGHPHYYPYPPPGAHGYPPYPYPPHSGTPASSPGAAAPGGPAGSPVKPVDHSPSAQPASEASAFGFL